MTAEHMQGMVVMIVAVFILFTVVIVSRDVMKSDMLSAMKSYGCEAVMKHYEEKR